MASHHPILTVLQQSQVSPPPATVSNASLPLTFFDMIHLRRRLIHHVYFYERPLITKNDFIQTILPKLKHSLSITLQHFFPFAGNLIVYRNTSATKPEIRYVEGDSVEVTSAECNLDFKDLTGNHPRSCGQFHCLTPVLLGDYSKIISDYIKIPVYSIQITLFPEHGFSIGMTMHHSLVDASSYFCFLEAWTCIARHGTDKLFLANTNIYPFYERVINYPELDEKFLSLAKIGTLFNGEYQPSNLSSTNKNKVRATFVLARTIIDQMKKRVLTQEPTISYVSSLTVTCAYIWCCIAKSREDELEMLYMPMDCRTRMDKPIPAAYFGNCVLGCVTIAKTSLLIRDDDGFINVARLLGENLHNMLTDKDGTLAHGIRMDNNLFSAGMPTTITPVSGTPKLKYYNLDFGWGKLKKKENVSLDYGNASMSIDACKESNDDLEIGISLTTSEMQTFVRVFNQGLQLYL